MGSWVQYGKNALEFAPGNEDGFTAGKLKGYGKPGYADFFQKLDVTIEYTSAGTVTGMTEAQVRTYLQTLTVDLRLDIDRRAKGNASAQDPANIFHPFQALDFDNLRLEALRLLEKEWDGFSDTTTGLRRGYTAGEGTISFVAYVPITKVAFVPESALLYGMGPDMLELMRMKIRAVSDGLNAFDSDLTTDNISVVVSGYREKVKGNRASMMALRRQYQPGAQARAVETARGLVLDADDANAKLSLTTLGALTTEVGEETVADRLEPSELHEAYTANQDVSTPETNISNYRTPVYEVADTPFANLRTGAFTATQETLLEEWNLWSTLLPLATEQDVRALIMALTDVGQKTGRTFHFVNSIAVAGLKVDGRLLPFGGLTYFDTTEPEAQVFPGLRAKKEGEGRVSLSLYVPPEHLQLAAARYRSAKSEVNGENPSGNLAKMDAAVNELGYAVPGFVEDEVRGYPSTLSGRGGTETSTYRLLRTLLRRAAGEAA